MEKYSKKNINLGRARGYGFLLERRILAAPVFRFLFETEIPEN
jgi:hypothetical protein